MTDEELKKDIPAEGIPGESAPVTDETAPAEEAAVPPTRKHADRLAKAFPDRKIESDEDYDAALDEHLTGLESYKERGTSMNQKLIALFEAEPQVGEVVRDMINGATFREALALHLSPEDLKAVEGDPDYEGWTKNKTAREEKAAKARKFEEDYANNLDMSQKAIEEFAAENNMEEQDAAEFLSKLDQFIADANNGNISKESLSLFKKALNYDNDLATASSKAEIAGRNQNIVAKKEDVTASGDGLPRPANSSETPDLPKSEPSYMDGLVDKVQRRKVL